MTLVIKVPPWTPTVHDEGEEEAYQYQFEVKESLQKVYPRLGDIFTLMRK